MFESAELGHRLSKEYFDQQVPGLREGLLAAQYDLLEKAPFQVVLVVAGSDGAGKGETVNVLNEWMDPRHVQTHGMETSTDEERMRPPMYRFWRRLPPKGKTGLFVGAWYTGPIEDRALRRCRTSTTDARVEEIVRFERMLADEGALIIKIWLHLSKKAQKKRLKSLEEDKATRWRVTSDDWRRHKQYDAWHRASERVLRLTSTAEAPWTVVEGTDARYRSVTVAQTILDAVKRRLDAPAPTPLVRSPAPARQSPDALNVLRALDLTRSLSKSKYEKKLAARQRDVALLSRDKRFADRSLVGVWEGQDAAGKGGSIRRITRALDARFYDVIPISAPTDEELAQPYLWRFWRRLPRHGKFALFDRSWYGRVLVERVEKLAPEEDWRRAFSEINDFEEQLCRSGIVVVKFWLHISKEEQLRRFEARKKVPFKRYKLTDDDWRNRKKWDAYEQAAVEMIERTSTELAPWTLVPGDDKRLARIRVLETVVETLRAALDR